MTTDNSEWLTVAEAARRLGLSDRHARRLVDRLEEQDRLKQGTSPMRVRLPALAQLWERDGAEREPDESASRTQVRHESDLESDSRREIEEAVALARLEERLDAAESVIIDLRQDKRQLQDALQREQENHMRLLDQLAEERQELRLLQARVIQALPGLPERESDSLVLRHSSPAMSEEPPSAPTPPPSPAPVPTASEPSPSQPRRTLRFWERLAHWISD